MSLLETISNASSKIQTLESQPSDYPINLNPDPIFQTLKPQTPNSQPITKLSGWEISEPDTEIIQQNQKFFKTLKTKLKDTNFFTKPQFIDLLCTHLISLANKVGVLVEKPGDVEVLVDKFGGFLGRDVKGLVLEGCLDLEVYDVFEVMLCKGFVEHFSISNLVHRLIEKRKSDLLVLCLKGFLDLQCFDLLCILKYFLVVPSGGYASLVGVREYWEKQGMLAIEKASGRDKSGVAKEAAVLVMLGYDGFEVSELCLHYLFSSQNMDEAILSACVGKLNGEEIKSLVRYLGKLLRKYERFPQVGGCPKGVYGLGLTACKWIPSLDVVVKCLGVVVDEHFSSLVLNSEFHELRDLEGVVSSLAAEARICGTLANLTEKLRIDNMA